MNVGVALQIDASIDDRSEVVTELDDKLKEFFRDKSYGPDVENFTIGIILTSPDVDHLHPVRGLKYRKHLVFKHPPMEFNNVVEYDVRPDFDLFSQLSLPQAREYLSRLLAQSTTILEANKGKFPRFEVEKFVRDFNLCLRGS
jgi:hypothetical protein